MSTISADEICLPRFEVSLIFLWLNSKGLKASLLHSNAFVRHFVVLHAVELQAIPSSIKHELMRVQPVLSPSYDFA
jgi:hypothetical protein